MGLSLEQDADDYWTPQDQISLKKNKCGCVMEMGFAGDEVRPCAGAIRERQRRGRAACADLLQCPRARLGLARLEILR